MMQQARRIAFGLFTTLAVVGVVGQLPAAAQERFEITSIKAVRPTLVNTIGALEKRDVAAARDAFEAYNSLWNGIEMYVNTRSKEAYDTLEHGFEARIAKALESSNPDVPAVLADAKAMLVKFDETVDMITKAPALNPLFDNVARLRIVRAHLREVPPALKAGKFDKARKSFQAFDDKWDSIEDLVKERSADAYVAIEKAMIEIEQALMPEKPDVNKVTALVDGIMTQYNAALAEVVKEARIRR
jgi:tetratricopeptide (TPR) repeat protein